MFPAFWLYGGLLLGECTANARQSLALSSGSTVRAGKSFAAFCSPTFLLPLTSSKQQNAAAYSCTLRGFVLLCGALILLLSPKDERFELVVTSDV